MAFNFPPGTFMKNTNGKTTDVGEANQKLANGIFELMSMLGYCLILR
jgi:hypothetical protein